MNIIIFYQHICREVKACSLLKQKLESVFNARVEIFSIDFEYFKALNYNKRNISDIVLMPWVHDNENYRYLVPFISDNSNLIAVNLHHEQIATPISNVYVPRDMVARNNLYHFAWGDYFANKLITSGISSDLVKTVGNMRLDLTNKVSLTRQDLAKEFNLDISKRWLMFCENRDYVFTFGEKDIEFLVKNGFRRENAQEQFEYHKISLNKTYDEINNLTEEFFKENELIYRPHPGTLMPVNINKNVKVTSNYSISEWIQNVDVYLTASSTSIFEAEATHKPCFIWDNVPFVVDHVPEFVYEYEKIVSLSELTNAKIEKNIKNLKEKSVYDKYIGKCDYKNTDRIAEEIQNIYNNKDKFNIKMELIEVPKGFFRRKKMYEKITKFVTKLGIIRFIKFPKSAYREMNDIPFYKDNLKKYL